MAFKKRQPRNSDDGARNSGELVTNKRDEGAKAAPRKAGRDRAKNKNTNVANNSNKRGTPDRRDTRKPAAAAAKGKKKEEKKAPATAEELDAEMDSYWIKSGKTDQINKKLDDDMDAYWAKKETAGDAAKDAQEKTA